MEKQNENQKTDESSLSKGPYHLGVIVEDVKKSESKTEDSDESKNKDLSSSDDGCGNGY